jgi:hypothetical protein
MRYPSWSICSYHGHKTSADSGLDVLFISIALSLHCHSTTYSVVTISLSRHRLLLSLITNASTVPPIRINADNCRLRVLPGRSATNTSLLSRRAESMVGRCCRTRLVSPNMQDPTPKPAAMLIDSTVREYPTTFYSSKSSITEQCQYPPKHA